MVGLCRRGALGGSVLDAGLHRVFLTERGNGRGAGCANTPSSSEMARDCDERLAVVRMSPLLGGRSSRLGVRFELW